MSSLWQCDVELAVREVMISYVETNAATEWRTGFQWSQGQIQRYENVKHGFVPCGEGIFYCGSLTQRTTAVARWEDNIVLGGLERYVERSS